MASDSFDKAQSFLGTLWQGTKKFAATGFGKGLFITAAVFVAAVAIFAGLKGGESMLEINHHLVNGEQGFGAGMGEALRLLVVKPISWGILLAGGAIGAGWEWYDHRVKEFETKNIIAEMERSRQNELQPAVSMTQAPSHYQQHVTAQTPPPPVKEKIEEPVKEPAQEHIQEMRFCAAEARKREQVHHQAACHHKA